MFCNLHTSIKPINRLCMEKLITKSFTHHFAYAFFFLRDFRTDKHFAWYYEWVLLRWIFGLFLFLFSFLFATLYQYFQFSIAHFSFPANAFATMKDTNIDCTCGISSLLVYTRYAQYIVRFLFSQSIFKSSK